VTRGKETDTDAWICTQIVLHIIRHTSSVRYSCSWLGVMSPVA